MTGKRIGLVIGNNYPDSKQELRFAVADALAMKEVLLNKDICGFNEVEESIDDTFVDARIKIEKILIYSIKTSQNNRILNRIVLGIEGYLL